ncbi:MAG: alkyl sulfatase dimerization domain-containing protein [Pseudomonadales bacterium]
MRTPLYTARPQTLAAARFGVSQRINDFVLESSGNSNSYLLETPDGNILINTGMGFEAPVHHSNYSTFTDAPIKYAITTQGHVDHVGGMQFFRDKNPGLSYIAQAGNQEHQEYDGRLQAFRAARSAFRFHDSFIEDFTYYAKQGYTDINPQDKPTPDIVFDQRHELTLGGLSVVLIAAPGAETNDSLIVWLPDDKICLTGNIFGAFFGHIPNLVTIRGDRYRDAISCAAAAQLVMDLGPEVILYGHHQAVEGAQLIQEELTAYRDATLYIHDETVKGMNAGKDLNTLQQEIQLPAELEVGQGYGKVSWNIRAIWENYAGWFKHQSTTELYSVPATAIDKDLLDLAGADALVARAAEKQSSGQPEQALHLLNIVLGAEPSHAAATSLCISVHEDLLSQSENFWLSGWLENQIKLLKGGVTDSLSKLI